MDTNILTSYGIDWREGISRCLDDPAFYERFLAMFLEDHAFSDAKDAFLRKDYTALFRSSHELKGACGNAAMKDLYNAVVPLVELLRNGGGTDGEVALLFDHMEVEYNRTREGVALALKG